MAKAARNFAFYGKQAIIYSVGTIPETSSELVESGLFGEVLSMFLESLRQKKSSLLKIFPQHMERKAQDNAVHDTLRLLSVMDISAARKARPDLKPLLKDAYMLHDFSERLYNFWRSYERFFVCHSENGLSTPLDQKPYRTFNDTIARLNHMTRKVYRDVCENITGDHPRIYRQVAAGCQLGVIASDRQWPCPPAYKALSGIPFIRQVYMSPPLILDPPMNKRDGFFSKVSENPLKGIDFPPRDWICYPAKVCESVIHIFFHARFTGLGVSLANLFELAEDSDLVRKPDAVYAYGVPQAKLKRFGKNKTVFYEDRKNGMMVGAVPGEDAYGYFGYLKKMVLTLHNSISIRKGRLPVHGAMVRIEMRNGKSANVVIWGDTGAGKSETLEAFRVLGDEYIRGMKVVFDDMGALDIRNGKVVAYGTETGAFVRLDDLQPGFAFGNMDRAIIHSPHKINSRVIIPVTTQEEVTKGHKVDFLLYANNYQEVNEKQKILEEFSSAPAAMSVFREGSRMAKGTTREKGIVNSYFANPFGPLQYEKEYEKLAKKYFEKIFSSGTYVGQLRTRLGIPGFETKGPEAAARELFSVISKMK
jgi:hypothetical protein